MSKFRYFVTFLILSFLLSCLILTASAHRGNTDGSGGHYNKSTGEYHYHHGYPEHSHRDMNGDGKLDCPYEFHDKTGQNSGSSSSGSSSSSNEQHTASTDSSPSLWPDLVDFFSSPYGVFCIIAVIIQIAFALILIFVNLPKKPYVVLLITTVVLFIASIKVSGPLIIGCFIAYIIVVYAICCLFPFLLCILAILYNGVKWLISFLFSPKQ